MSKTSSFQKFSGPLDTEVKGSLECCKNTKQFLEYHSWSTAVAPIFRSLNGYSAVSHALFNKPLLSWMPIWVLFNSMNCTVGLKCKNCEQNVRSILQNISVYASGRFRNSCRRVRLMWGEIALERGSWAIKVKQTLRRIKNLCRILNLQVKALTFWVQIKNFIRAVPFFHIPHCYRQICKKQFFPTKWGNGQFQCPCHRNYLRTPPSFLDSSTGFFLWRSWNFKAVTSENREHFDNDKCFQVRNLRKFTYKQESNSSRSSKKLLAFRLHLMQILWLIPHIHDWPRQAM